RSCIGARGAVERHLPVSKPAAPAASWPGVSAMIDCTWCRALGLSEGEHRRRRRGTEPKLATRCAAVSEPTARMYRSPFGLSPRASIAPTRLVPKAALSCAGVSESIAFRYAVDGIGEDTTVGAETLIASRYPVDGWGRTPRSAPRRSAAGPFSVPVSTANA